MGVSLRALLVTVIIVLINKDVAIAVVLGDVSFDDSIGVEEAISALKTAAGSTDPNIMNVGSVKSAYGTYSFEEGTGVLTSLFTHSNFPIYDGPPVGVEETITVTFPDDNSMIFSGGTEWTKRKTGSGSAVTGVWELNITNGEIMRLFIGPGNSIKLFGYADDFRTTFLHRKTITIDGIFSDWSVDDRVYVDDNGFDCGNVAGRDLLAVSMVQDENFLYLRYELNAAPDTTFRYMFGQIFMVTIYYSSNSWHIMYSTPVQGLFTLDNGNLAINGSQIEFKVDLCDVNWDRVFWDAWLDDFNGSTVTCRDHVELPHLELDRSSCQ